MSAERTIEEQLLFACTEVVCCARQVGTIMPKADEIVISMAVYRMVINAMRRAEEKPEITSDQER